MKDKFAFLRRKSPDPSSQQKHLPADPPPRDVIENWKNGFSILLNDKCRLCVITAGPLHCLGLKDSSDVDKLNVVTEFCQHEKTGLSYE